MNKLLIAVDTGKHTTKALMFHGGKEHISSFRTKVQKVNNIGIDIPRNSFLITFNNEEFLVGEIVSENYTDHNLSKQIINHKIAVYTAIVDLISKAQININNVDLYLVINAPINIYKDAKLKKSYHDYIYNNGQTFNIVVNNDSHSLRIKSLTIAFEGIGLVYANSNNYAKTNSTIIDVGGLNATYCNFNGIRPDFDSMIVSTFGISALKSQLENHIVSQYGIQLSSNDLENILMDGYLMNEGKIIAESEDLIEELKQKHLDQIVNYAKRHGYTFNNRKIYFVGGGSVLLSEQIKETFPLADNVINPQFANVKSFLSILKVKHTNE